MIADDGSSGTTARSDAVVFEDADGLRWSAWEYDSRYVPGCRSDCCLVFESENAMRRVWSYPANWRQLPADDLAKMSWKL